MILRGEPRVASQHLHWRQSIGRPALDSGPILAQYY
jgi:hypothetical protein